MSPQTRILEVYATGELTVVGFHGVDMIEGMNISQIKDELVELLKANQCKVLAFDMTGVKLIPSGMIGLLANLRKKGLDVHLYNPSRDIQDVMQITKLNELLHIHEIDIE